MLKRKCLLFLELIKKIEPKTCDDKLILNLNLHLDEVGNILLKDLERIVVPTVYNIRQLQEIVKEANSLSNLTKKEPSNIRLTFQLKDYLIESEIPGFIPLTESNNNF